MKHYRERAASNGWTIDLFSFYFQCTFNFMLLLRLYDIRFHNSTLSSDYYYYYFGCKNVAACIFCLRIHLCFQTRNLNNGNSALHSNCTYSCNLYRLEFNVYHVCLIGIVTCIMHLMWQLSMRCKLMNSHLKHKFKEKVSRIHNWFL